MRGLTITFLCRAIPAGERNDSKISKISLQGDSSFDRTDNHVSMQGASSCERTDSQVSMQGDSS